MTFAQPIWLALLALPLALLAWNIVRTDRGVTMPFDHAQVRRRPVLGLALLFSDLLPVLLLALVVLLLASPTRLVRAGTEREVTNIEICLDVSGSMGWTLGGDRRSRYEAAMDAIARFTEARTGDACGLTIFGGENVRWTPLTQDLDAIRLATPFLDPARQPTHMRSTRIGAALRACAATLSAEPEGDRMVVLISDGVSSDLGGDAAYQVGRDLADVDVTVYAIHVGGGSAPSQIYDVVAQCGGRVFAAEDTHGLNSVFEAIDRMEPARQRPSAPRPAPWFQPLAFAGLILLVLHLLASFGLRHTPW